MGTAASTAKIITDEFNRITKGQQTDHLTLAHLLQFQTRDKDHQVDPTHIGTLFVMDTNRDGKFDLDEIIRVGQIYSARAADDKLHSDFQTQFQAYTALQLWKEVSKPGGEDAFVEWFAIIFSDSYTIMFPSHPGEVFVTEDGIRTLYRVLNIGETYGMDFQTFFDLIQRVGEEQGIMKLNEEELDYVVPLNVVKQFARDFIKGFMNQMKELGFQPDIKLE